MHNSEIEKELRPRKRKLPIIIAAVIILFSGLAGFLVRAKNEKTVVGSFLVDAKENLKNTNNLTNVAIMGVGGEGHEAPDLTDSMIFVSYDHTDSSIFTLPIPRDVWVESMQAKVNTAYHYGNERREGGGIDLAKSAISEITGQPVHYALVLDFEGFVKVIDAVGGIEVEVERSFDDYKYPIPGKENAEPESERYEHLHFDSGLTHMDGETALKFARSRHAEGEEGTDFARSARQQKIIEAFISKVFSTETLLNPSKVKEMAAELDKSIDTDIKSEEYVSFLKLFLDFRKSENSLESGDITEYLETPKNRQPYQSQWVLIPIDSWQEIHTHVKELVTK